MTKKTSESYKALLQYIKDNIFDLEPSTFISDYEEALRSAVKSVYPKANLIGCWLVMPYT